MSFFDEVETTVANTRFLQAVEDNGPIKLNLALYEELGSFEKKVRSRLSIETLLKPNTTGYYLIKKWLKEEHSASKKQPGHIYLFLDSCDEFRSVLLKERRNKAIQILQDFLKPPRSEEAKQNGKAEEIPLSTSNKTSSPITAATTEKAITEKAATITTAATATTIETSTASPVTTTETSSLTATTATARSAICSDEDEEKEGEDEDDTGLIFPKIFNRSPDAPEILEQVLRDSVAKPVPPSIFHRSIIVAGQALEKHLPTFYQTPHYQQYIQLQHYKHQSVQLKDFRVFRVLGRGAFGAVSAVQKIDTQAIFAMKEMGKKQVKQNQSEWMCINEKKVLSKMRSPFVLNLKYSFHDEENLYLIFDMCGGGDLKYHLRNGKNRYFSNTRAQFYAAQVLCGLEHIHSFDIVYRDLKPTNLLLDQKGNVKISDLGLTIKLRKNKVLKHLAGTAGYWAPEIVKKAGTYKMSDYWSYGVFLYEMLKGKRPRCVCRKGTKEWCSFGQNAVMEKNAISKGGVLKIEVEYPQEHFTPEARDLLKKLFEADPKKRIGAQGVGDIKNHPYFDSIDWNQLEALEIDPPFVPDSHTVHANSIGEVGEFNKNKYRKIKLSAEDQKHYNNFKHTSDAGVEEELTRALEKMDNPPAVSDKNPYTSDGADCCCVLL